MASVTVAFVLISAVLGLGTAYVVIRDRAAAIEDASLQRALETRTRGAQTALAQALYREWEALGAVQRQAAILAPADLQNRLNAIAGNGEVVSWAGYADTDGTVLAASNGLLVGQDVSQRPWFREGLKAEFAGDAHEAVLLASLLPPQNEPLRFIDFAVPLVDANGATQGVLGLHVNVAWMKRLIDGKR